MFKMISVLLLLAVSVSAQSIDSNGVLPSIEQPIVGEWSPMDVEFDIMIVDGIEWHHTMLYGLIDVLLGPNNDAYVFIGGRMLASGGYSIVDQFYDGSQNAVTGDCAAGTKVCWAIPLGGGVTTTLKVQDIGHGATLSAAIESYKAKITALKAAGWVPRPSSTCGC